MQNSQFGFTPEERTVAVDFRTAVSAVREQLVKGIEEQMLLVRCMLNDDCGWDVHAFDDEPMFSPKLPEVTLTIDSWFTRHSGQWVLVIPLAGIDILSTHKGTLSAHLDDLADVHDFLSKTLAKVRTGKFDRQIASKLFEASV